MRPLSLPRTRPTLPARRATGGPPEPFSTRLAVDALGSGIVAAVGSWLVILVPVLLGWALGVPRRTSAGQMLSVSVDAWALAHRASLSVDGLVLTLAPLALTALAWFGCYRAWRWLAGPEGPVRDWLGGGWWEPVLGVAGYLCAGMLMVTLANLGQARILWWSAVPGLLLLPVTAALAVALRGRGTPAELLAQRAPLLAASVRPAALGAAVAWGGGVLLVLVTIALRWSRVMALHRALDPDTTGSGILALAQGTLLPNLGAWALGWAGGAPVSIGEARLGLDEARGGTLPLVPVLGVLPEGGSLPWFLWLAPLLPLAAGLAVAWVLPREVLLVPVRECLAAALLPVLLAAIALALAFWLSGGGVAPGGLSHLGVSVLLATVLVGLEMAVASAATILLRRGFLGWRG